MTEKQLEELEHRADLASMGVPVVREYSTDMHALVAEVRRLKGLVRELDDHEGAEGWSEDLRNRVCEALR